MWWFFRKKKKEGEFMFKLNQLPLAQHSLWKLDDETLFDYLDELVRIVRFHKNKSAGNVIISIERIIHVFRYRYDPRDAEGHPDTRYFCGNEEFECPFVEVALDLKVRLSDGQYECSDTVFSNWIEWLDFNISRYRANFQYRHQRTPRLV